MRISYLSVFYCLNVRKFLTEGDLGDLKGGMTNAKGQLISNVHWNPPLRITACAVTSDLSQDVRWVPVSVYISYE